MKLIADRQLTGDYGTVTAGQIFEVRDDLGEQLVRTQVARPADAPRIEYDTKVITPAAPEVGARQTPFRDVPVRNEESSPVAPGGDSMLSESNLLESATADPGRRRGRAGSASR